MKSLVLVLGLVLLCPLVSAAAENPFAEAPIVSEQASVAPVDPAGPDLSQLFTPAPENKYTYITWSGGTCTAWLYCPGEPYWKCQSTSGNCQHDYCSITCNGITKRCPTRPGQPACISA
jgi:hypothetical protein